MYIYRCNCVALLICHYRSKCSAALLMLGHYGSKSSFAPLKIGRYGSKGGFAPLKIGRYGSKGGFAPLMLGRYGSKGGLAFLILDHCHRQCVVALETCTVLMFVVMCFRTHAVAGSNPSLRRSIASRDSCSAFWPFASTL